MVFIAYQGTSALEGLYMEYGAADLALAAERWANSFAGNVPDALVLASALLVLALLLVLMIYRRHRRKLYGLTGANDSVEEFADEKYPDRVNR